MDDSRFTGADSELQSHALVAFWLAEVQKGERNNKPTSL